MGCAGLHAAHDGDGLEAVSAAQKRAHLAKHESPGVDVVSVGWFILAHTSLHKNLLNYRNLQMIFPCLNFAPQQLTGAELMAGIEFQ